MSTASRTASVHNESGAAGAKFPGPHKRVALGAAISEIGFAVTFAGLSFFTPMVLTEFQSRPEFTTSSFLLYYTIYGITSAVTMVVAAQRIDKLKANGLMILGGAIAAAGLVLFAFSQSLWMFYAAGLTIGVGVGMSVQYVPIVVVNRWFIEKRGTVLGAVLAGSGVGGMILGFVVPPLIGSIGWRSTMLVMAAIMGATTILPGIFMIRNNPEDEGLVPYGAPPADKLLTTAKDEWEPGMSQQEALKNPWFWVLLAALAIFGITYGMTQHLVNYLNLAPWGVPVSAQVISTIVVLATVLLIPYKPLLGWVVDKIGLEKTLVLAFAIASIGFIIFAFARTPAVFIGSIFFVAVGLATGTVTPPLIGERAFGQRDFSKLWGILGMAYPVGLSVGASLWGLIPDFTGTYFWGFVAVPVVTAVYVISFLLVIRNVRAIWVPPALVHLDEAVKRGEVAEEDARVAVENREDLA